MDIIKENNILKKYSIIDEGFESTIHKYDDAILLKRFKTTDKNILNNKINKLEILSNLEDVLNIKIIALVEENGIINSYLMENKKNYTKLSCLDDKKKNKIEILINLKEYLKNLNDNNIIYGDLNLENVLKNEKNQVCCCDLDNVKINNYDFDIKNNIMREYLISKKADMDFDSYMFNILTLSYLIKIPEIHIMTYLRNNSLPYILNTKENRKIVESMMSLEDKIYTEPLIDHIKRYHF